jgi:hypothetical protein
MSVELTLVRCADVPAIATAARLGDAVALALLNAVHAFEAGWAGKQCLICERLFRIEAGPKAFWISSNIAIGVCEDCAALSDRKLRRRLQKYSLEI